jgi:hypothetical protein
MHFQPDKGKVRLGSHTRVFAVRLAAVLPHIRENRDSASKHFSRPWLISSGAGTKAEEVFLVALFGRKPNSDLFARRTTAWIVHAHAPFCTPAKTL